MRNEKTWNSVDHYFTKQFQPEIKDLEYVRDNNQKNGLPEIDVTPTQGKFLAMLAQLKGAKNILEIGTLGGYSTIWLARTLPENGKIVTLEVDPTHAKTAQANINSAKLADKVTIIEGPALTTLPTLQAQGFSKFDFIFIDADKPNNPHYIKWALQLAAKGAVIVSDNVVRDGEVINKNSSDEKVIGIRKFIDILAVDERADSVGIQTVGEKGYDGFVLTFVQ
ncbi:O-methyltransferase [Niallia circulans]|uniref:O-methyltransferase n=1 Tax=Niallia circulans TaxID=1397 RepID=A0A553STA5_NIACI|nr:O-methyltransferase [Niallia circulans]TRZ40206.1 O-methyltransferase [Niallia circulans]